MGRIELAPDEDLEVQLTTPVVVSGYGESGAPFEESTYTLTVGANGSLIQLLTPVQNEQLLLLKNVKTEEEMVCYVETRPSTSHGSTQVKVGFTYTSPRFWGVSFPAVDWSPASQANPMQVNQ